MAGLLSSPIGRVRRLADPGAEYEIDRLYQVIQSLKVNADAIDAKSVGSSVGAVIEDGQLEVLNRVLSGATKADFLNSTKIEGDRISLTNPNSAQATAYFEKTASGHVLHINKADTSGSLFEVLRISAAGGFTGDYISSSNGATLSNAGQWVPACSIIYKTGLEKPNKKSFLQRLSWLKIWRWRHKNSPNEVHLGPSAEDFRSTFGLAASSDYNLAGAALFACQCLLDELQAMKERMKKLEGQCH